MCRHRGLGMNRAKKSKPSPLVPRPTVPRNDAIIKEPAPAPAPDPIPSRPAPATDALVAKWQKELPKARLAMVKARKEYEKVHRRWVRTAHTHFDEDHSPWADPSVVARVKQRLQQADDALDKARAEYVRCRREWSTIRTFCKLSDRKDMDIWLIIEARSRMWQLATNRAMRLVGLPDAFGGAQKGHFERQAPRSVSDVCAKELGVARAWGLIHSDDL